jgi:hypothetical protein
VNEKEQRLLEGFSKLLGNPEVSEAAFREIEEKAAKAEKDKKLLERLDNILTGIIEPKPVSVPITEKQSESLHNALVESMDEFVEPIIIDETFVDQRNVTTRQITQPNSTATPVEPQPKVPETMAQPLPVVAEIPKAFRDEMNNLRKSVLDLHQFASRISQHPAGGGAGSVDELTFRAIGVTTDYQAKTRDYYIGVNCPTTCTITLPTIKKTGYQVVVKDESGHCSINNITVVAPNGGTIDNDTSAIMSINNMSLTFIYRNGWRII